MAHAGGRPPKYCQEMITKTREYIDRCVEDEQYQLVKTQGMASTSYENKIKVFLPTIEGLSLELGVTKETIRVWKNDYPEFSVLIKELLALQAEKLIQKGLSGDYSSKIAKLLLSKHGYVERQEHTGADGKDLIPQPIYGGISISKHDSNEKNIRAHKED